ncbi:collectin-10 isoform X3 [Pelobates cultripes]|uniref:Collectin-10 isoform X3 n=1 Tax=Pelobates cultripes TaxID=61616 RepID=A0AAD1W2D3_PELCU|nr:collectin-10 isoform X3 [Pelobates cultripes]
MLMIGCFLTGNKSQVGNSGDNGLLGKIGPIGAKGDKGYKGTPGLPGGKGKTGSFCDCGRYRKFVGQLDNNVARLKSSLMFVKNGELCAQYESFTRSTWAPTMAYNI